MKLQSNMLLKNLIKNCPKNLRGINAKGLSSDTRTIKKGNLFFAIKGSKYDGNRFIEEAFKKGACAVVLSEKKNKFSKTIFKKNIQETLIYACKKYYKKKPKNIIAVTGTNGKSSVADFFHQFLTLNKIPVASIGTLGVKIKNFRKLNLTSPDIITLHKTLKEIKKLKIENVILEASSHGISQKRLSGLKFKIGIFTNFSQDHLDYHKTMKKYLDAKLKLFTDLMGKKSFIITNKNLQVFNKVKNIALKKKIKIKLSDNYFLNEELRENKLVGEFQQQNLEMSALACHILGIPKKKICDQVHKIKNLKGRLELVKELPNRSKVFIDYAHTPDAVKTVIKALIKNYKSNVTIIFGCGGERDKNKRGKMGKIANRYCNKVYITDDNPRNESPKKIRNQIKKYVNKNKLIEIGNRSEAIKHAIKESLPNDIILITGKGHESYQDYGKKILNISDYKILNEIKINKKRIKNREIDLLNNREIIKKLKVSKLNKGFLGASINSKSIKKNNLFIPIKGKKKDGHAFIQEALKKKAAFSVSSNQNVKLIKGKIFSVKNTNTFLNSLAIEKRLSSNASIIGVTGSSGKTSVKEILGKYLKLFGDTYYSPRSFNNHYGVPISLCNLEKTHKFGIFEIGMSYPGEINKLSKIIKPHIGIITNVAEAHIENFQNLDGIAHAKGEIINNISKNGFLIIDRDGKYFRYFEKIAVKKGLTVISFGFSKKANIFLSNSKNEKNNKKIKVSIFNNKYDLKIKKGYIKNILILLSVLKCLNLDIRKILKEIKNLKILEGRGKVSSVKYKKVKFNLIDESYNANPLSMKESIANFSKIKTKKTNKYLLLGDMLELGKKTNKLHKRLVPYVNNSNIDKLFVHGKKIVKIYKNIKKNKQGNILQHKSDVKDTILPIIQNNDYLMIKGSNGTGLYKISSNLIKGKYNAI